MQNCKHLDESKTRIATIDLLLSGCKRHQSLHHLHVFARGLILPKQIDPKLLQVWDRKGGSHKCCHSSSGDLSLPEAATSKTWAWAPSPILWRAALSWKVTKVTSAHKDYEPTKQIDSRMYDLWFITYYIVFIIWMCVYIICKSRIHQNIVYHNESNVTRAIWYHLSFVQSRGLHWFWSIYADVVRCYNLQVAYIGLLHLVSCLEVCSSKLQTNLINEDCSMCIRGSIEQVIK